MRQIKFLSPTSFALYEGDRDQFYQRYLSERRFARDPQTLPMAVGSAFDCEIKQHLLDQLGDKLINSDLKIEFDKQVEEQNRAQAKVLGQQVMGIYKSSGALTNLMTEIYSQAKFEFSLIGEVKNEVGHVVLNGKPDAYYKTLGGNRVVLDWKVNGWMSPRNTTPSPGFIRLQGANGQNLGSHKNCHPHNYNGVLINLNSDIDVSWMSQLSIYGWLLGEKVGEPFIGGIDQIVGPANKPRVATHRFLIQPQFQRELFKRLVSAWQSLQKGHVFTDMSMEESESRCKALESQISPENDPLR